MRVGPQSSPCSSLIPLHAIHARNRHGRRRQPEAGRSVHRDRAAGRRAGPRDQESALDHPPEHGAAGRGLSPTPSRPATAGRCRRSSWSQRECQRLQDLLDDFLRFAKVRRLKLEPSDLNEQVRQVLDFFRPKAEEAGDRDRRLPAGRSAHGALGPRGVPRGAVEPGAQRRAGDARRRAAGRPHLRHARRRGAGPDRHRLRHGRARRRSQIFDAFFSTKRGGSGLGLPTARKIIEAHGGRIAVQSEAGPRHAVHDQAARAARLPGKDEPAAQPQTAAPNEQRRGK